MVRIMNGENKMTKEKSITGGEVDLTALERALLYFEKSLDLGVPNKPKHAAVIIRAAREFHATGYARKGKK